MAEIVFGGRAAIEEMPVIFANCNVNSPLRFDSADARGHPRATPRRDRR